MAKKLFKVTTKCGHVGRYNYLYIEFPIVAENAKEASRIARWMPRAKHHDKYCIASCVEISKEEYIRVCKKNDEDPYLKCKNKQEQNLIKDLHDRIFFSKPIKKKKHDLNKVTYKRKKYDEFIKSFTKYRLAY